MNATGRLLSPLILLFIFFGVTFLLLSGMLLKYHFDPVVLHTGNALCLAMSIVSVMIQLRSLHEKNPHVFVRGVMTGMLVKMAVCILAVFLYVYFSGDAFNKRGIFLALFIYLVYLAVEVAAVMKLQKNKKADA